MKKALLWVLGCIGCFLLLTRLESEKAPVLVAPAQAAVLGGEFNRVHDPSRIIECDGTYYLFHTGRNLPSRTSPDLINWTRGPSILPKVPDWARKAVPAATNDSVWAPDLIFWRGKYLLFYSFSTFGSKTSVIGLLTNPTLNPEGKDYAWKDEGLVVATTQASDFNAIDAAPVIDERGDLYLTLGSWNAGGIKVMKLDENAKPTGKLVTIAAGQSRGPEAPYLHRRGDTWTLFANHETCCAGMNSTYRVVVGQSKSVFGPYLDKTGRDMAKGGGTAFLETEGTRIGPGHIGIWRDGSPTESPQNGLDYSTFHFYDGQNNGVATLAMQTLWWDSAGWPHMGRDLLPGRYSIASKVSRLALETPLDANADGVPIQQAAPRSDAAQSWNISPSGDGFYSIRSMKNGKFIDLNGCRTGNTSKISQSAWGNTDCQRWRIEQVGDGTYRVVSKGGKTALTMPDDAKTPQRQAAASPWQNHDSQSWIFQRLP